VRLRPRDIPVGSYLLALGGPALVSVILPHDMRSLLVPALCYLLCVVAAAAVGRIGPGLLAAAVSTAGLLWVFIPDVQRANEAATGEVFAVGVFAVTALVVSGVLDRLEVEREKAERAAERLARLQTVTAALSQAADISHVTQVVVEQACRELGGERGTLSVLDESGTRLQLVGTYGMEPETVVKWQSYPVDGRLPASEALRSGDLVLLETVAERNRRYPEIAATPPYHDHALACVPLLFEGRAFGVISLSFGETRVFAPEDRSFLVALGAQCAQALDRARLYEAERETARRQAFLAEASRLLATSLDYTDTLGRITRLAVPDLADTAAMHLWDGDQLRLVALAHAEAEGEAVMRALSARDGDIAMDPTMIDVATNGTPIVSPEIPQELWAEMAEDDEHRRLLETLGTASAMLVALSTRGRPLGTLALGMAGSGRQFGEDDLTLVLDLASRAAVAIENSISHRSRVEQARVLQQSLLPPGVPAIPGLDVAVHYRAAGDGSIVGGDFFDLFPMSPGPRWGVVLGDVSGKGVEAASLTALARYTVRAVAMNEHRPSEVLRLTNRAVLEADTGEAFCTIVFAVAEASDDGSGVRMRLASGGHPLPVRRDADGHISQVGVPGTAIGLFEDPDLADAEVLLEPGCTIVLFTDGLIEARTPAGDFAPQLLAQTLRTSIGTSAAETVAAITAAVGQLEEGRARDDMAIVVLAVPSEEAEPRHVRIDGLPPVAVVQGDEYVDELVRELELVRLGGRQGVLRSDYPQRVLAVIEDVVHRYAAARGMMRDQAESALASGAATFTLEIDLPPAAAVAMSEFAALLDEVEGLARRGLLLTVPPASEVRALQRWLWAEIVRQVRGDPDPVPVPAGAGPDVGDRMAAADLPMASAPVTLVGELEATTMLAPDLAAAGHARRFVRTTLAGWGLQDVADEAELPLSELVTNAVMHTRTEVSLVLRLDVDGDALRIEVHDTSSDLPSRRSRDMEAGTGRGLELVEAIAHRWGVQPTDSGKAVWFELRTNGAA
jgi:GAF domain-containing protein/anti-sigma regulatory factor (Ser/Thr protein kinase)